MRFENKVAAVTGAGSGIGRALALLLAKEGASVAISDVDQQGLDETETLISQYNVGCHKTILDVSDREKVEEWANNVVQEFGKADYIFNNAGVALFDTADSNDYANFEWIMNINFWGMVYGSKAFLQHFKDRGEGHVINVSSLFGLIGFPNQSAYNSSKFAIRGYTEALALEMEGSNIKVSSVHPGGIKTDIARNCRFADENLTGGNKQDAVKKFDLAAKTTPAQAAEVIVSGVLKGDKRILIGKDAKIMDWIQRLMPQGYGRFISKAINSN
ncbi:SDR family NAD(P)-dependent oxidoreductase [Sneathiella sp. P13V-1]|uniref:SDR family NAD(P)-dependent oxidoreductase n=1 Tax=Sneathiella sp. P13V-1 TaxID=2697366 RepID=UPI00187B6596|nr:SDR family oxidoreductase [Sneathiella sp. P13V-1]MBE7637460.1 SDR family NAD(P)-dependent oxidoreductase [Sneathiella sp. P13V-1]